jgi:uncharacterized protein YceH (UPF0502 family)
MAITVMNTLNPAEVRVLASLIEKDITTPDYYPLTLNALTNACSQTSNRDPVIAFADQTVVRALDSLREKKLAYVFQGADSRVPKYGHRIAECFSLARPEIAVLCTLMLRGPQTVGEIRGRSARMHSFQSLGEAEGVLDSLAARSPEALVVRLPRQLGMKEQRFAHLLAGEVPQPAADTETNPEAGVLEVRLENERLARLEEESAALRREIAELRREFTDFRKQLE